MGGIPLSMLADGSFNEWNKIYIDLTSVIINTNNADSHTLFISMERDINSTEIAELYLDNFKIVY